MKIEALLTGSAIDQSAACVAPGSTNKEKWLFQIMSYFYLEMQKARFCDLLKLRINRVNMVPFLSLSSFSCTEPYGWRDRHQPPWEYCPGLGNWP